MKLINTFLRVFFLITLFHFGLFAAPANKTQTHTKTQPNGKTISYISNGDEFMSWLSSIDGYTMFENAKGEIVYATKDENAKLVKSNILASDPQQRSADEILFLSSIEKGIFYNTSQLDVFNKLREERYANTQENYIPTIGTPNFLVILVNFTDVTFNTANATKMSNQIKQTNYTTDGATGSVKDYFYDNSMGTLNANFTVVGPYTLSHNQAYYGAQDSYDNDVRPREMVAEACLLANPHINYANFDNDGDGYVDMIHIVYAGRGEHNGGGADAIWPHSWGLSYPRPNYDGVTLRSYSCSNELRTDTEIDGIGTICHEMGHVLGLPDFYDTDYEGTGGQSIVLGSWDLMSSGNYNNESRTPPYLSALERNMLGWLTPIILTNNNTPCTLPAISDSNKAYKVNLTSNEFFIFEHRNKKKWDAYTPAKGMLVFHGDNTLINQWINSGTNEINVDPLNRGFFILPAYGDSTNNTSTSTTFPGSQNVTSFIGSTLKSFTPTGKALTEISYGQDSVLNFTYFNIIPNYNLTILPPTNITTTSATLNGTVIGSAITSMGFQYRKLGTSNFTQQTVSTNPLQLTISNLTQNTIYEYRLFIISSIGTTYSNIETFFTDCGITLNPPFSEGFESTLTCWNNISSSTDNIDVVQNGGSPSCTPHGGTRMLKYNSYNIYANEWAGLITPKITFPHSSYEVSLWIYRYNGTYSQPDEGVEIYINSSISLTGATQIGFISNNISEVPVVSSNGWYKYSCNVGSAAVGEKYIILKVVSNYGYNTYIDDLSVTSTSQTLPPTVITSAATTILQNTATLNGAVVAGSEVLISQGFEWKQSGATNWTTSIAALTSNSITNNLIGLIANTTYQFRAYATTATGTTYGSVHSFTTLTSTVTPPTVITSAATTISQNTATLNGAIVTGSEVLISQGFEWKQSGATNWTTTIAAITGNSITHNLIGLNANTTYQFRAYATTATGTTYGSVQSFTTLIIVTPPTVITSAATTISQNTATLNGAIVTGSEVLISQGFEWKQSGATNWTTSIAVLTGNSITHNLIGLNANTAYEFRAYATTTTGTTYGSLQSFTTLIIVTPPTVITSAATTISQNTATLNGAIVTGSETIISQGFEWKLSNSSTWTRLTSSLIGNSISHNLISLTANTAYEFRAYATTAIEITYGTIQNFTTLAILPPIVVTNEATTISGREAILNGIITLGSETITKQGFEWKLIGSNTWMPVISTLIGNTINHNLTDLTPNIDYEFKAYATTASGTTYGTIKSFITLGINGAHENKISIMVYPNPANSQTNLIITGISGETKITLSDIQGRTLNTINTKAISRILEQNIDLNNLAKGIYYIRIQNSDINKTQKLIVK